MKKLSIPEAPVLQEMKMTQNRLRMHGPPVAVATLGTGSAHRTATVVASTFVDHSPGCQHGPQLGGSGHVDVTWAHAGF